MNKQKNKIRKINPYWYYILSILTAFVLCVGMIYQVHASTGINANEARVLAVVQSTFKYQGKYYRAKAEYISQVAAYLDQDDVDLTASQANTVISRIYGSIPDGISGGYLYEVQIATTEDDGKTTESSTEEGSSTGEDDKTTENSTEEGSSDDGSTEDDSAENSEGSNQEESTEPEGVIVIEDVSTEASTEDLEYDEDIWKEVIGYENYDDGGLGDRPDENQSASKIIYDNGELLYVSDKEESLNQMILIPTGIKMVAYILTGCLMIVTIGCACVLFANKCFVWRKNKKHGKRHGHSTRRKIRKAVRMILTVTGMIEALIVFAGVIGGLSLYRQDTTMTNLNTCGYFRYAYNEYCDNSGNEPMEYEEFLFEAKKEITSDLAGKEVSESVLYISIASYIYKLQQELTSGFGIVLLVSVICILLTIIILIFHDGIRYRGERRIAIISGGASVVTLIASIAMTIAKPYTNIYIEPDYLYLFIHETGDWMNQVMYIVSAFGMAISLILLALYRSLRKNDEQN